jgi:hypothetical protein
MHVPVQATSMAKLQKVWITTLSRPGPPIITLLVFMVLTTLQCTVRFSVSNMHVEVACSTHTSWNVSDYFDAV